MKDGTPDDHRYFLLLLAWRGVLAALALHAALEKPFEAMLSALAVIGTFALIGESAYRYRVHRNNERRRLQREQELRERRAEEVRLRQEAARQAQRRRGGSFGLDDEASEPPSPVLQPTGAAPLSPAEFDAALRDVELEQRHA